MISYERFFQEIDDFIDDELDFDMMEEFEQELEDEFCYHFFNTFKKTVELCHQIEMQPVPRIIHYRIIQTIEDRSKKPVKRKRQVKGRR